VQIVCLLLQVYSLVIFARIILEWIPVSYDHPVARVRSVLRTATEPVLAPFRRLIPPVRTGTAAIDLSPIVVMLLLAVLIGAVC
jgi:YggT family protein